MSRHSVWYDLGIRDGEFHGVDPTRFLNTAANFFIKLKHSCRKSIMPGYTANNKALSYSFAGLCRWHGSQQLDWSNPYCKDRFIYQRAPLGTPITPENLAADPIWDNNVTSPSLESILKEPRITREYAAGVRFYDELEWQKQLMKLIQAMRYCIIPIDVHYMLHDGIWREWYHATGCVNNNVYWSDKKRMHVRIPEYWDHEGLRFKLGVWAKKASEGEGVPVEGAFWVNAKEYTIVVPPELYTNSLLRIYGVIDLSIHPDFREYFEHSEE